MACAITRPKSHWKFMGELNRLTKDRKSKNEDKLHDILKMDREQPPKNTCISLFKPRQLDAELWSNRRGCQPSTEWYIQYKKLKGWWTTEFMIKNSNVSSYGSSSESETSSKRGITTRLGFILKQDMWQKLTNEMWEIKTNKSTTLQRQGGHLLFLMAIHKPARGETARDQGE